MPFVAGQKVRASELNAITGAFVVARCTTDVTKNASTTLGDVTGLGLSVAANATYALDGWIYFESNPTADIKFALTLPSGSTGVMGFYGPNLATAPVVNQERINYVDMGVYSATASATYGIGGDDEFTGSVWVTAQPRGVITTSSTAGTIQVQFAQNTSNASNTKVKAGSWMRATRLA